MRSSRRSTSTTVVPDPETPVEVLGEDVLPDVVLVVDGGVVGRSETMGSLIARRTEL